MDKLPEQPKPAEQIFQEAVTQALAAYISTHEVMTNNLIDQIAERVIDKLRWSGLLETLQQNLEQNIHANLIETVRNAQQRKGQSAWDIWK